MATFDFLDDNDDWAITKEEMDILYEEMIHNDLRGRLFGDDDPFICMYGMDCHVDLPQQDRTDDWNIEELFSDFLIGWEQTYPISGVLFHCTSFRFPSDWVKYRWFEVALNTLFLEDAHDNILMDFLCLCAEKIDNLPLYKWLLSRYACHFDAVEILGNLVIASCENPRVTLDITSRYLFNVLVKKYDMSSSYAMELMKCLYINKDLCIMKRKIAMYCHHKY
jgi:hypothetical protein